MKPSKSLAKDRILSALRHARAERDDHAEKCPAWDYEGSDCIDCQDTEDKVRKLVKALSAF